MESLRSTGPSVGVGHRPPLPVPAAAPLAEDPGGGSLPHGNVRLSSP
jgi:hypothetical protein|eukprot:COSAG06_NODE_5797_length_3268_cov_3.234459_3_plen_47_part_00